MFKLFNGVALTSEVRKYHAYNGVLTALDYDPQDFHAHLIIGLNDDGLNISFSYCKKENSFVEESMFAISFDQESKVHLTFNSNNIYYATSIKLTEEILDHLKESILKLYLNRNCHPDTKSFANPKALLSDLSSCVTTHVNIIKAYSTTREAIRQNIPMFIELLTSKFNDELQRLEEIIKERPAVEYNRSA
ncbi:MAG: hypothetical protein H0W64_05025 [Gammaproteobacteria bacterium]|nr:hypothetical protein [Gammaproteobacteria bacterium]